MINKCLGSAERGSGVNPAVITPSAAPALHNRKPTPKQDTAQRT